VTHVRPQAVDRRLQKVSGSGHYNSPSTETGGATDFLQPMIHGVTCVICVTSRKRWIAHKDFYMHQHRRHMRTHTGEKPYMSMYVEKCDKSNLKRRLKYHK
ncbi:hypothetical protein Bbelb_161080, partial [Branchiostoma belcheri]